MGEITSIDRVVGMGGILRELSAQVRWPFVSDFRAEVPFFMVSKVVIAREREKKEHTNQSDIFPKGLTSQKVELRSQKVGYKCL